MMGSPKIGGSRVTLVTDWRTSGAKFRRADLAPPTLLGGARLGPTIVQVISWKKRPERKLAAQIRGWLPSFLKVLHDCKPSFGIDLQL